MTNNDKFSSDFFAGNRRKLKQLVKEDAPIIISANGLIQRTRGDDAYPFEQESNFWYLSGIDEPDVVLVIEASREYLILPARHARHRIFSQQLNLSELSDISGIKNIYDNQTGWQKLAKTLKTSKSIATLKPLERYLDVFDVYTNPAGRTLMLKIKTINPGLKLVDLRGRLAGLRAVKTSTEIEAIKTAIKFSGEILAGAAKNIGRYENERDIEYEINNFLLKAGLKPAFDPIVAAGKNAAVLHYHSNSQPIGSSDFVLVDFGVKFNNYCSDITRTMAKNPGARQKDIYRAVEEVQSFATGFLKPGVTFKDYESAVNKFMGKKLREIGLIKTTGIKEIKRYYPHNTSHSLGIDVHDPMDYSVPIKAGYVLTVEPGIYTAEENIGVRIEDNVLITETGCEILSSRLAGNLV